MLLPDEFFTRHPVDCAVALLGCELRAGGCAGRIVETEAYCETGDEACHTFLRKSARAFVAANPPGTAYVYLNYGMHWLANVLVKGPPGNGFVLIRALEPTAGIPRMRRRRGVVPLTSLCSGPAKLTQALAMDGRHHGIPLCHHGKTGIHRMPGPPADTVLADSRIGISRAVDLPWRFLIADNPHVSRRPSPVARPFAPESSAQSRRR